MAKGPLASRLLFVFAGMIVLVVGVCGAVLYLAGQHAAREQEIDELARLAKLVREQLPTDSSGTFSAQQQAQLRSWADVLATRVTLIDGDGKVLLDTQADPSTMENHNDRAEIVDARRRGSGSSVRFSHTIQEDAVYVAQPLDPAKPAGVIVRVSYPRRVWTKLPVSGWAIVLSATLSAGLLMTWLGILLHRRWIGPVQSLSRAAERMAQGRWGTRVDPVGADEIREFSGSLNHLAAQAEKQLADLDARRSELQALVDSLPDPILLTDSAQRVALINQPAARLLDLAPSQAMGKKLVGVLNDVALVALIESAAAGSVEAIVPSDVRLTRNGQKMTYQALATRVRGGGVLLVLRDVSTLTNAVQMKTDFVANASHELRTPIAAIKMAFETLQDVRDVDPQQTEKCLGIISGHLNRLEEMLADLLDLSRVESPDLRPSLGAVETDELFAMVRATMQTMARQKGVELSFEAMPDAPVSFDSDRRLLNLILRNLIENSIKFTAAGGKVTVSVGAEDDGSIVTLRVADTGIGIPPEHLERVFERFYQVDAARSSAVGRGTGLGLAIVKHATHALGGTVQLESKVGSGTTVTCRIPYHAPAVAPLATSQIS
jgi:two-component system phosphate regulon sensor histidine kinase PhoR